MLVIAVAKAIDQTYRKRQIETRSFIYMCMFFLLLLLLFWIYVVNIILFFCVRSTVIDAI